MIRMIVPRGIEPSSQVERLLNSDHPEIHYFVDVRSRGHHDNHVACVSRSNLVRNSLEPAPKSDVVTADLLINKGKTMRGILLWLIGIPIPIIILLWLIGVLH
jgi:hypothetical protein